ncbi:hypothetical protein EYZ11_008913 [Aspergillus tanneri]|uniref:Uncharacterized protein n=1 Tax=Aspergillus tanneri TaxID=1220188 RepID=A0A4S3J987_9EURO|nr:hypothetical protein EYZ11_008913 [Aspergillus tanneri]
MIDDRLSINRLLIGGVTHVLHIGSLVLVAGYDPMADVYWTTVQGTASLLTSALKTPASDAW